MRFVQRLAASEFLEASVGRMAACVSRSRPGEPAVRTSAGGGSMSGR